MPVAGKAVHDRGSLYIIVSELFSRWVCRRWTACTDTNAISHHPTRITLRKDPGAFDTKLQCNDNDAASNWPAEFQYCTPEKWGLQCGACLQTCYFVETEGGNAFLPFQYTLPSVQLFAETCDVRAVGSKYQNESNLGNYWCVRLLRL